MKKTYIAPAVRCLSVRFGTLIATSGMNMMRNGTEVNDKKDAWTKRKEGCEWHFSTWGENEEL